MEKVKIYETASSLNCRDITVRAAFTFVYALMNLIRSIHFTMLVDWVVFNTQARGHAIDAGKGCFGYAR
jgi:hypothetical protein